MVVDIGEALSRGQSNPEVLILLSGGIDSAACLDFYVRMERPSCALFVDYGQAAAAQELHAACAVADYYGLPVKCLRVQGRMPKSSGLITGRNAFLVTVALMEKPASVSVIVLGIHAGSSYADCTGEFLDRMQALLDVHEERVHVAAPFLEWSKAEVLEYCLLKNVPIALTYSCENGSYPPCGKCLSCKDGKLVDARTQG
jgi:7-cyano-7-deazaguanine synthase